MEKNYFNEDRFKYFSVVNNTDNMTCIEFLRLSPELMIALSDKRATVGGRVYDTSSKVYVKNPYVVMGSGRESNIIEIERSMTENPASLSLDQELEKLKETFYSIYIRKAEESILRRQGITLKEYQSGKIINGSELSPTILENLRREMNDFARYDIPSSIPTFGTALLFGGHSEKRNDMEIHEITSPGISNISLNYSIMGSGTDRGEPEFEKFFKTLPQTKKDKIELGEGLYTVLRAEIAAEENVGVGGIPDIAILEKGKEVKKIDNLKSRLMRNLVVREIAKGENEKIKPYLEKLARDEIDAQSVIREITLPGTFLEYDLHS